MNIFLDLPLSFQVCQPVPVLKLCGTNQRCGQRVFHQCTADKEADRRMWPSQCSRSSDTVSNNAGFPENFWLDVAGRITGDFFDVLYGQKVLVNVINSLFHRLRGRNAFFGCGLLFNNKIVANLNQKIMKNNIEILFGKVLKILIHLLKAINDVWRVCAVYDLKSFKQGVKQLGKM